MRPGSNPNDIREIKLELRIKWDRLGDYELHVNLAPTTRGPVVTSAEGERTMEWMRRGLIPSWAKDTKMSFATFNARADTVASKPRFRSAWKGRRLCLAVSDGSYKWRKTNQQPFAVSLGNRQPMLMAGLWEE